MRVGKRSKESGKSIAEVGLRGINGLFLFEIVREDGTRLKAVDHDTQLESGDVLWFAGTCLISNATVFCCHSYCCM